MIALRTLFVQHIFYPLNTSKRKRTHKAHISCTNRYQFGDGRLLGWKDAGLRTEPVDFARTVRLREG
jgi:hypothetical protein